MIRLTSFLWVWFQCACPLCPLATSQDIVYSSLCYIGAPCCLLICNSYANYLVAPKMPFPVSVFKPKSNLSLFEIRVFFFSPDWSFTFHINLCLVDYSSVWTYQTAFLWYDFSSVQSLSHVWLFATPWSAAHQANLSITNSQSLLKLMSRESVMPSNHLLLCRPLLLTPPIFPSIRVFSNESVLHIRCILRKVLELQTQSFQWLFKTDFL